MLAGVVCVVLGCMGAMWGCAATAEYTKSDIEVTTHTLIGNVVLLRR